MLNKKEASETSLFALPYSFRRKEHKKEAYAFVSLFAHPYSFRRKEYKRRSLRLCKPLRTPVLFPQKRAQKKEAYAFVSLFVHPYSFRRKEYKKRSLRLCKPLRHLYSVFVSPDPGFVHWWMHSPPLERTALCGVFGYAA